MSNSWLWQKQTRRAGSAILAITVEFFLILPFLRADYAKTRVDGAASSSLVVVSLTKPAASPPRSIPKPPTVAQPVVAANPEPGSTIDAVSAAKPLATDSGCSLSSQIATAIQADVLASQAMANMPADLRSLSDAIMLWNGQWAHITQADVPDPVSPIRLVVIRQIQASPMACQSATITGPMFIAVPDRGHVTMLIFGSGNWRWQDLLQPNVEPPASDKSDAIPFLQK